jgi:hypothetical protein
MEFFNSFSHIRDGISRLSDKEIILQANESPKKLKDSMRTLLKKIEKLKIKLNSNGEVHKD